MATAGEICTRCGHAIGLAPKTFPPDLPTTPLLSGAPDWYSFEHQAWSIGEHIRQTLVAYPRMRADVEVQLCLLTVVETKNLRRGRQPFVMCLGFAAAAQHAPALATYLGDPDIDGHVLDTLIKMKAAGYAADVTPLLTSKYAWVRRLAKRYIERFPAESVH